VAHIKIIDDDVEYAKNVSTLLAKAGYKVSMLDTTDKAIEHLVRDRPDLLILDVMFPDNPAAGFDLTREIRRRRELKNLPIILLTGVNQEFPMDFSPDDIDPDWMPVQDFVEKPANAERLLKAVRKMLSVA
jgi:DNA-binding response OmpR family regulator